MNIEIIGKDEQSDRIFGPGGLGHVASNKKTIVLLHYATANPHYRLAVELEEEAGGAAMSGEGVEDDSVYLHAYTCTSYTYEITTRQEGQRKQSRLLRTNFIGFEFIHSWF